MLKRYSHLLFGLWISVYMMDIQALINCDFIPLEKASIKLIFNNKNVGLEDGKLIQLCSSFDKKKDYFVATKINENNNVCYFQSKQLFGASDGSEYFNYDKYSKTDMVQYAAVGKGCLTVNRNYFTALDDVTPGTYSMIFKSWNKFLFTSGAYEQMLEKGLKITKFENSFVKIKESRIEFLWVNQFADKAREFEMILVNGSDSWKVSFDVMNGQFTLYKIEFFL